MPSVAWRRWSRRSRRGRLNDAGVLLRLPSGQRGGACGDHGVWRDLLADPAAREALIAVDLYTLALHAIQRLGRRPLGAASILIGRRRRELRFIFNSGG